MGNNINETAQSTVTLNGEQAKQEMSALENRAKRLKDALLEANKAGDEKQYDKLAKQLRNTQKEMRQLEKDSFDLKKVLDNLSGASMRDLNKAKAELDKQFSSPALRRGTKEWYQVRDSLKSVREEQYKLNQEIYAGEQGIGKFANNLNKYFAMASAGIAALTGLTLGLKKFMDARNELEDSKANLKALTGLGDADINKLEGWATEMATKPLEGTNIRIKSSVSEIMQAYKLVGSAKPELLKDAAALNVVTKQSMILSQAAGIPLQDAVMGTVTALNQYSASADQAAKFVNILAAGSQAGAKEVPYISEALVKSGAVLKLANVPFEQSVALIEAIGEKGHQAEIAGTGLKTFFVKLLAGPKETNPALVGTAQALENLNKKFAGKGGFSEMVKLFGQDNVVIAQTIIENRKRFVELTAAVTNTNTAIDQANITSSTTSARMAQAQNELMRLGMQLVQNLNPAMLKAANLGNVFMRFLVELPTWLKENAGLLGTLAAVMTTYTLAVAGNTIAKKANEIATKALDSSVIKFFKTLLTNPYVAIGAAIATVTVLLYKWSTAQTEAQKAYGEFTAEYSKQSIELNTLFEAYKNANSGTAEKARLLKVIKEQYGPYIQNLIDEKGNITDIDTAQKLANDSLREQIALKVKNASINKLTTEEIEKQAKTFSEMREEIAKQKGDSVANVVIEEVGRIFRDSKDYNIAIQEAGKLLSKYGIKSLSDKGLFSGSLVDDLRDLGSSFSRIYVGTQAIDKQFAGIIKKAGEAANAANTPGTGTNTGAGDNANNFGPGDETQKKKVDLELQKLETENTNKLTKIKQQYIDGSIKTEYDYNQKLLEQQSDYDLQRKKKIKELLKDVTDPGLKLELNNQIAEIDKKALERQIKQNNDIKKIIHDADPIKAENDSYDNRLRELGLFDSEYMDLTEEQMKVLELLRSDHLEKLRKLSSNSALEELNQLEKDQEDEMQKLAEQREKTKMDEQVYKDQLLEIEIKYLRKKLAVQGVSAEKIDELTKQLSHHLITGMDNDAKEMISFMDRYGLDELGKFKTRKELELKLLEKYLKAGLLKEKDAARVRAILASEEFDKKTKNAKELASEIGKIAGNLSNALTGFQSAEETKIETKYQKQIDAAQKAGRDTTSIEEQKNKELAALRAKDADAMFALQVAQIIAATAVSAIEAYSSALKIPIAGLVLAPIAAGAAVLYGASQIAQAEAAREKAKAGYADGGFTPSGDKYQEVGPVHAGEFVGSQESVKNPQIRRVFNLIDYAQRTNTVARINADDIARAVANRGYAGGGYVSGSSTTSTQPVIINSPGNEELTFQLKRLSDHLDKGISAKTKVSGNDGIAKAMDDYNNLIKNVSR